MKYITIGDIKLKVCEHQGDINYLRFVKFKQLAPQFVYKMEVPLFDVYLERYMDYHDKGKHGQALMQLHDYKLAVELSNEPVDVWGKCFALISGTEKEDIMTSCPDDAEVNEKIILLSKAGLTPSIIKKEVINFMKASAEEFTDLLLLLDIRSGMSKTR